MYIAGSLSHSENFAGCVFYRAYEEQKQIKNLSGFVFSSQYVAKILEETVNGFKNEKSWTENPVAAWFLNMFDGYNLYWKYSKAAPAGINLKISRAWSNSTQSFMNCYKKTGASTSF